MMPVAGHPPHTIEHARPRTAADRSTFVFRSICCMLPVLDQWIDPVGILNGRCVAWRQRGSKRAIDQ